MKHMLDIFFQSEYGKLYESIEHGNCEVFEYKGSSGTVQNMFIKRPVPWLIDGVQYYDVTTPYGYGGPVVSKGTSSVELVKSFYANWIQYCHDNRIIAEFIRFHLFDNTIFRDEFYGDTIHVSENVVRPLDCSLDEIWMQVEHKVRKNVKKAQSDNLSVSVDTDDKNLDSFLSIYYETMQRNHAKDYYYFDRSYFERIVSSLAGHYAFFNVWHEDVIVSTELVLCSNRYVYSFLGGTLEEYYPMRPNDFLKWEIIRWSKETGRDYFILGGGYGANNGIYRYKKSFAPGNDIPFYVGRAIHNETVYTQLVAKRCDNGEPSSGFFPLYRG